MISLMLLFFLLMMFVSIASAISRAGRRRRMLEEQRRLELERQQQGGGGSPFAGMPFGGLLDAMMGGAGGWTRSVEYDEQTGQWVDVDAGGRRQPEPAPEAAGRTGEQPRFERKSPRRQAPSTPLTTCWAARWAARTAISRSSRPTA